MSDEDKYEYKKFVWKWSNTGTIWPLTNEHPEWARRKDWWAEKQREIKLALQKELDNGWEPISEVGPDAIELYYEKKQVPRFGLFEIILWIVTLSVVFWIHLLAGLYDTYTYCSPIGVVVELRRVKKS